MRRRRAAARPRDGRAARSLLPVHATTDHEADDPSDVVPTDDDALVEQLPLQLDVERRALGTRGLRRRARGCGCGRRLRPGVAIALDGLRAVGECGLELRTEAFEDGEAIARHAIELGIARSARAVRA